MSEHIPVEELAAFAFSTEYTPEVWQQAAKINAHLLRCPDCAQVYSHLLELEKVVKSLHMTPPTCETEAEQMKSSAGFSLPMKAIGLFLLQVKTKAHQLLLRDAFFGAGDFGHPVAVGARSGGQQQTTQNHLIDNENALNEILLSSEKLHVRLDAEDIDSSCPTAALVSPDGLVRLQPMARTGEVWVADFNSLEDADYTLIVQ